MSNSDCGLNDKVVVHDSAYPTPITGIVIKVYDNGDLYVEGIENWEWTFIRVPPSKAKKL